MRHGYLLMGSTSASAALFLPCLAGEVCAFQVWANGGTGGTELTRKGVVTMSASERSEADPFKGGSASGGDQKE
ncbi:MAG: hypothetical protein KC587_18710 [Nitrospira sp.]|nr:hypothetical protein [Nitrospira sp.]